MTLFALGLVLRGLVLIEHDIKSKNTTFPMLKHQTAGHSFFSTLGRISEGTTGNISSLFTDTLDDL